MNKKLEVFYENQFEMFLKQGWKDFIEDTTNLLNTMTIETVNNESELFFRKGQKDCLNWVLQRQGLISDSYEQLLNEEAEDEENV
jgi:hypothetical protein